MPLEKLSEKVRGKSDAVSGEVTEGRQPGVTDVVPVVPHKVLYTDIPFFTDKECTQEVAGARIAVLQPLDPDGFQLIDIVPTTKEYAPGQYLSWQLNKENLWEECYFRNPVNGQIEQAWTMHVEFIGRIISDQALAKDKQRIEKLEALYKPKDQSVM